MEASERLDYPVVDVIGHDPLLCEFCKQMDALRVKHYEMLTPILRIPASVLNAMPIASTYDQELATQRDDAKREGR